MCHHLWLSIPKKRILFTKEFKNLTRELEYRWGKLSVPDLFVLNWKTVQLDLYEKLNEFLLKFESLKWFGVSLNVAQHFPRQDDEITFTCNKTVTGSINSTTTTRLSLLIYYFVCEWEFGAGRLLFNHRNLSPFEHDRFQWIFFGHIINFKLFHEASSSWSTRLCNIHQFQQGSSPSRERRGNATKKQSLLIPLLFYDFRGLETSKIIIIFGVVFACASPSALCPPVCPNKNKNLCIFTLQFSATISAFFCKRGNNHIYLCKK